MNPNDTSSICGFYQGFENEIGYLVKACEIPEGIGFEEILSFPKGMEIDSIKKFIETLYYSSENEWVSTYLYEPNGAGCYYKIVETEQKTGIERWCGC